MSMTEAALAADGGSQIHLIPLKKIYADSNFNCRGQFTANDIIELARDIAVRGLVEPIIVRPIWSTEDALKDKEYDFSLVAGFRRYSAYKVNKAEKIPCIIREIKSEFDCFDINAVENLQRKDLTFWQEARSIRHYWLAGWTREEIAVRISKSSGWVQLRIILLEMQEEIQVAADQGYILPSDMHELNRLHGDKRLQMAGKIRDSRKAGKGKSLVQRLQTKEKPGSKKKRSNEDLQFLSDSIRDHLKNVDRDKTITLGDVITPRGNCVVNRILGWAAGDVTSLDVHLDIRDTLKSLGIEYQMPEFQE